MKQLLFSIFLFLSIQTTYGQDIIQQKNGSKLKVKIVELADNYVKYYHFEDPNKVVVKMNRSLIRDIQLEYGRTEKVVEPELNENYFVDDHINNIKLNFTGIAGGATIINYERALNPFSSWEIGAKILGLGINPVDIEKSGFGIEGGYKIKFGKLFNKNDYRPKHILAGYYLKPGIGFTSGKETEKYAYNSSNDEDETKYNYVHGGLDFGKQWVLNNTLTLDPYIGLHYYGGSFKTERNYQCEYCDDEFYIQDANMVGANNKVFRYGINVGYSF